MANIMRLYGVDCAFFLDALFYEAVGFYCKALRDMVKVTIH